MNDQPLLNVDFDYDSLPDVLLFLKLRLVSFLQCSIENNRHKEFYILL